MYVEILTDNNQLTLQPKVTLDYLETLVSLPSQLIYMLYG